MFRNERLEMKVGIFIGVGIFLMFMIVFSISDFYFLKKGYNLKVVFDFVNGITEGAPVRLAGVDVGEVEKTEVFYDEELAKTRVRLMVRVYGDTRIEKDAIARINTLGLLGEQYLEVTPGAEKEFVVADDTLYGSNPVNIGQQMEQMAGLIKAARITFQNISEGKGTLGKFITDERIYDDIQVIFERLRKGEGTIGKLLVEDKIYDDLEAFVADIKANPWKLLSKPRSSSSSKTKR